MDDKKITSLSLTKECESIIEELEFKDFITHKNILYDVCALNFDEFQQIIDNCKNLKKKNVRVGAYDLILNLLLEKGFISQIDDKTKSHFSKYMTMIRKKNRRYISSHNRSK